jgi:hypothetical protein
LEYNTLEIWCCAQLKRITSNIKEVHKYNAYTLPMQLYRQYTIETKDAGPLW